MTSLNQIIPFEKQLPDKRWTEAIANKFVILLKQFYKMLIVLIFFVTNLFGIL